VTIPFALDHEESLIVLPSFIEDEEVSLVLDTGASHTIVDLTKLLILGYRLTDSIGTVQFQTAKGIVEAYLFEVKSLRALGLTKENIRICAYDFMLNNVFSEIDGVLGLDFLRETELWISFSKFLIDLKPAK